MTSWSLLMNVPKLSATSSALKGKYVHQELKREPWNAYLTWIVIILRHSWLRWDYSMVVTLIKGGFPPIRYSLACICLAGEFDLLSTKRTIQSWPNGNIAMHTSPSTWRRQVQLILSTARCTFYRKKKTFTAWKICFS